jgi:hypothetical protein
MRFDLGSVRPSFFRKAREQYRDKMNIEVEIV